jgi:hypothetical protein
MSQVTDQGTHRSAAEGEHAAPPPISRRTRFFLLIKRLPWAISTSFRQLLHVLLIRYCVALVRYLYFVQLCRRLRCFTPVTGGVSKNAIAHNLQAMADLAVARSETLIRPVSVIDRIAQDIRSVRVLSIGPRTEGELLNLLAYGFAWRNLRGLDLISYSPKIDLGDMHAMPYEADSWDVVLLGWVLAYSEDRDRVAKEVIRVGRPGAIVAVGVEYGPQSNDEVIAQLGYLPGAQERITAVEQILGWFGPAVETVYVRHDVEPPRRSLTGSIYTVFSIRKS